MNPDLSMPVILQVAGVLVIIAEIIIPSGGILSIIAACLIGYSLYHVFTAVSVFSGVLFLLADALILPVLVYFGLKMIARSPVTLRHQLSSAGGVTSQAAEMETLIGRGGVTVTDLRPSGKALIAGKKTDVVSRGEYLAKGVSIQVVAVSGNQVIVEKNE